MGGVGGTPRYVSCVLLDNCFFFLSDWQIKHSDIDTIPAANGEGAVVARLFCLREPEVVVDQYSADIDAAPVVICSRTLWLQTFLR